LILVLIIFSSLRDSSSTSDSSSSAADAAAALSCSSFFGIHLLKLSIGIQPLIPSGFTNSGELVSGLNKATCLNSSGLPSL